MRKIAINPENSFIWSLASCGAKLSFSTIEGCCSVSSQMCAFQLPPPLPTAQDEHLIHWSAVVTGGTWCRHLKGHSLIVSRPDSSGIIIETGKKGRLRVLSHPFSQALSPRSLLGHLAERFFRWEVSTVSMRRGKISYCPLSPSIPVVSAEIELSQNSCRFSGNFFLIEGKLSRSPFPMRIPLNMSWAEFSAMWDFFSAGHFTVAGTSPKMPYCLLRPDSGLAVMPRFS